MTITLPCTNDQSIKRLSHKVQPKYKTALKKSQGNINKQYPAARHTNQQPLFANDMFCDDFY